MYFKEFDYDNQKIQSILDLLSGVLFLRKGTCN